MNVGIDGFITAAMERHFRIHNAEIVAYIREEDPTYLDEWDIHEIVDFCLAELGAMMSPALEARVRKCMAGEAPWLASDVIDIEGYYFNNSGVPALQEASVAVEEAQSLLNEIPGLPF